MVDTAPNGDAKNGEKKYEDRTPVEELFDLTKPLKRVDRPDKDAHEEEIARLSKIIDDLKEERRDIQAKIDAQIDSSRSSEVSKIRDELSRLRSKKGALISEKKSIRARLDATRNQSERLFEDKKRTKDTMRYTTMEEIDAELKQLQRRQETTSMSLMEEKRLIKEMDTLKASKKLVSTLKTKETNLESVREQRKVIASEISAKDKEIDLVQVDIENRSEALKALSDKETDNRSSMQALFAERDDIKKKLNDAHDDKNEARQAFREINNKWYDYQRALRAQRRMQAEEEKKQREEEKAAWLKQKEEEELLKIPYEEEMALCDYLADYLTKTYLTDTKKKEEASPAKKDVVQVTDDPFAGFKPVNKKDDDIFLKMGEGKKPRSRKSKKSKNPSSAPFTLSVDSFDQFGMLSLFPPTCYEQVEASVQELRDKKKWYSEQPRGSVRTALEIRKANQKNKAAADDANPTKTTNKKDNFALSTDDFVPLGGAPTHQMAAVSSWGKNTAVETPTEQAA